MSVETEMEESQPPWTAKQIADMLGITDRTVRYHARRMKLGTRHGQRVMMFLQADLERLKCRPVRGKYERKAK